MAIVAGIVVAIVALAGVALTLLTLPGIWIAILCAALVQWWYIVEYGTELLSWWTLGTCVAIAAAAEIIELFASAAGAKRAGGTKRGAIGSVIGGVVGAIAGSILIPVPVIGTLVGAAAGAGSGALLLEKAGGQKTWTQSGKIGAGAAAGRLVASVVKTSLAGVVAVILIVGVCW